MRHTAVSTWISFFNMRMVSSNSLFSRWECQNTKQNQNKRGGKYHLNVLINDNKNNCECQNPIVRQYNSLFKWFWMTTLIVHTKNVMNEWLSVPVRCALATCPAASSNGLPLQVVVIILRVTWYLLNEDSMSWLNIGTAACKRSLTIISSSTLCFASPQSCSRFLCSTLVVQIHFSRQ